jgi:hypothetical protein
MILKKTLKLLLVLTLLLLPISSHISETKTSQKEAGVGEAARGGVASLSVSYFSFDTPSLTATLWATHFFLHL